MVAVKKGMRAVVLAAVLGSSFTLAACNDGHPGYNGRGHHHDRHDGHRDHDHRDYRGY